MLHEIKCTIRDVSSISVQTLSRQRPRNYEVTHVRTRHPFGDPEGARSNIDESFVKFEGSEWGDLAMEADDRQARVIVGSKGSGKTVYLRRLHANTLNDNAVYAERAISTDPPETKDVIRFCEDEPHSQLTESWSKAWHRAILRATISHLCFSKQLTIHLTPDVPSRFLKLYKRLLGTWRRPRSIYDQMSAILGEYRRHEDVHRYLNDELWGDLENDLAIHLADLPPLFFYLDYLDEKFEAAPLHWHRCQLGLFHRVMTILRDQALGGRLHVIIAVRDMVYSSLLRSEHRGRYIEQPHIRLLSWDAQAITYLLDRKIDAAGREYHMGSDQPRPIDKWLGSPKVRNSRRNIEEDAYQYVLRHTRLLPRDIVTLGEKVCSLIAKTKQRGAPSLNEHELRDVIRLVAKGFGLEQLEICARHVAALTMPRGAARGEWAEFYVGNADYNNEMQDAIVRLLREDATKDRLSRDELDRFSVAARQCIAEDVDLPSVLWQNGLLGFVDGNQDGGRDVFFPISGELGFTLPRDQKEYVFHSCLIDAVGLKAVGSKPVYPSS